MTEHKGLGQEGVKTVELTDVSETPGEGKRGLTACQAGQEKGGNKDNEKHLSQEGNIRLQGELGIRSTAAPGNCGSRGGELGISSGSTKE